MARGEPGICKMFRELGAWHAWLSHLVAEPNMARQQLRSAQKNLRWGRRARSSSSKKVRLGHDRCMPGPSAVLALFYHRVVNDACEASQGTHSSAMHILVMTAVVA